MHAGQAGKFSDMSAWLKAANVPQYEGVLLKAGWDLSRMQALDAPGRQSLIEGTVERNRTGGLKKAHLANFKKAFGLLGPPAAAAVPPQPATVAEPGAPRA